MLGSIVSVLFMGVIPLLGSQVMGGSGELQKLVIASPMMGTTNARPVEKLLASRRLSASGYILIDRSSGQTVAVRGADRSRPMASLTKLMTALLIVENHAMDEWVKVPDDVFDAAVTMLHLPLGEEFVVGDMLKALLIGSSNEAAITLARFHSGSVDAFVKEMNVRAAELGLKRTYFQNPTGFDEFGHASTPREIGWLAMYVLGKPVIAQRMGERVATIVSKTGETVELRNTHQLLGSDRSVLAGKTGTTDDAKQCLLSLVQIGGREYIAVLLHSSDRYGDMQSILAALARS